MNVSCMRAYLVCERACMTKKRFGLYLISERILYASVSYKRASTVYTLKRSQTYTAQHSVLSNLAKQIKILYVVYYELLCLGFAQNRKSHILQNKSYINVTFFSSL